MYCLIRLCVTLQVSCKWPLNFVIMVYAGFASVGTVMTINLNHNFFSISLDIKCIELVFTDHWAFFKMYQEIVDNLVALRPGHLTRYVILPAAHASGMPGTFSPPSPPLLLTSSFLWSRWRGKRSRHSRRMRNPQFYVSGKRSMAVFSSSYRSLSVTCVILALMLSFVQ